MIPGVTKLPQVAVATLPASLRASTPNQFATLLSNPDAELVILLIATPFNSARDKKISALPAMVSALPIAGGKDMTVTGSEDALYLSDKGYTSAGSDFIPHRNFPGRLSRALNTTITLFNESEPTGKGTTSTGDITIINDDGEMDYLLGHAWDGRDLKLIAGQPGIPLNQFGTVLKGTVSSINANDKRVSLSIKDPSAFLSLPLLRSKFGGTGGADGDSDLEGVSRPYVAGRVRNITPYLVSSANLLYQVHDGKVSAIDGARDKGVALVSAGDWSTVAALLAATTGIGGSGADIEAGEYGTCVAEGYFRLGGQPVGVVTADVKGDADSTYVNTTGAIVKRIVTSRIGVLSLQDSQIESSSVNALDTAQPAEIGIYVDQDIAISDVISLLMSGIGGYWYFNRDGQFSVGRLSQASAPVIEIDEKDIKSISRMELPLPVWRRRVGWRKSWTKQDADNLAGSVSDADRQLYGNEYRYSVKEDSNVKNKHRLAQDLVTPSYFDVEADADAEALRLSTLHGADRSRYRVTIKRAIFRISPGDDIRITYPRYNLTSGKELVVAVLEEESKNGFTTLEAWG